MGRSKSETPRVFSRARSSSLSALAGVAGKPARRRAAIQMAAAPASSGERRRPQQSVRATTAGAAGRNRRSGHRRSRGLRVAVAVLERLAHEQAQVAGERGVESSIDWFWQTRQRSSWQMWRARASSAGSSSISSGWTAWAGQRRRREGAPQADCGRPPPGRDWVPGAGSRG